MEHEMNLQVSLAYYPDVKNSITFKVNVGHPAAEEEAEVEGLEFNHKLVLIVLGITLFLFVAVMVMTLLSSS